MPVSDTNKCPMCGAPVDGVLKKCASCGETLAAGVSRRVRFRLTAQLPLICAICGEPATTQNRVRFRQSRENLGAQIRLPVCRRHRHFHPLAWREMIRLILFSPIFIVGIAGLVERSFGLPIALIVGSSLVAALACLVAWSIWQSRGPRSPHEDLTYIVLSGVAPAFALACEQIDDREAEQVGDALAQMFQQTPEPAP